MRRKVIQQGPSTLMISLPISWVKENRIRKGDEINVEIINNQLIASPDTAREKKEVIAIPSKEKYLDRLIMTRYREGYNELIVKYDDPETIEQVRETLKYLLGFEIIDQTPHSCTIKNISEGSDEDYPSTFRRLFQIMVTMSESCLEYARTGDEKILKVAIDLRETLVKLEQFSLRMINKQNSYSLQKKSLEFFYVWNLGAFGRMWSSLARYCLEKKPKLAKQDIEFMHAIVQYVQEFQAAFYKRDTDKILRIKKKLYDLRPVGAKLLDTSKHKLVVFYLLRTLNRVYEVSLTF
jgi:phosphate uptake regulator